MYSKEVLDPRSEDHVTSAYVSHPFKDVYGGFRTTRFVQRHPALSVLYAFDMF